MTTNRTIMRTYMHVFSHGGSGSTPLEFPSCSWCQNDGDWHVPVTPLCFQTLDSICHVTHSFSFLRFFLKIAHLTYEAVSIKQQFTSMANIYYLTHTCMHKSQLGHGLGPFRVWFILHFFVLLLLLAFLLKCLPRFLLLFSQRWFEGPEPLYAKSTKARPNTRYSKNVTWSTCMVLTCKSATWPATTNCS